MEAWVSPAESGIVKGYLPGLTERVAELHATYYAREWNFGHFFEAKVATELTAFLQRYDTVRDGIWSIQRNGQVQATVSIDGSEPGHGDRTAHLRWFIVSDTLRGNGAGNALMCEALDFCRQTGFASVYLWTFQGLEAARHLYLKHGFELAEQHTGSQWGTQVTEQRYVLTLV